MAAQSIVSGGLAGLSAINPVMAGISAIAPIAKGIKGVSDLVKAKKLRDAYDQPMYGIPGAETEAVGLARSAAYDPSIAGQSIIEAGMDRQLASGNRSINEAGMSSAEKLAAINANVGSGLDAYGQLAIQSDNQQQRDQMNLQSQLGTLAGFQDKQWQLNKQQPWMDAMEAASRMDDAGTQNLYGAVNDLASVGAAAVSKGATASGTATVPAMQTKSAYGGTFNPNMTLPSRAPLAAPSLGFPNEAAFMSELESIRQIENSTMPPMTPRSVGAIADWSKLSPEDKLKYGKDMQLKRMGAY